MRTMLLDDETTWPSQVIELLRSRYNIFLGWELKNSSVNAWKYDQAICELRDTLNAGCIIRGYHCTRLTEDEIQEIIVKGMSLLNEDMLHKRITAIEEAGLIQPSLSQYLRSRNQANDDNRAGKIWFLFRPPHLDRGGQQGIEHIFRLWGGEAVYKAHKQDTVTVNILGNIGVPCIVEAYVPIGSLSSYDGLASKMIRRFLVNRDFETREDLNHEGHVIQPIPASNIARIIRFPEPDFINLTKCNEWKPQLQ